jgi:hypothetical protein
MYNRHSKENAGLSVESPAVWTTKGPVLWMALTGYLAGLTEPAQLPLQGHSPMPEWTPEIVVENGRPFGRWG